MIWTSQTLYLSVEPAYCAHVLSENLCGPGPRIVFQAFIKHLHLAREVTTNPLCFLIWLWWFHSWEKYSPSVFFFQKQSSQERQD